MQHSPDKDTQHGALTFSASDLRLNDFNAKQFIDLHRWVEPAQGQLQNDGSAETSVDTKRRDVTVYPLHEVFSVKAFDGLHKNHAYRKLVECINHIADEANKTFNYWIYGRDSEGSHTIGNGYESLQLLKYEAPSNGYDWHHDLGNGEAAYRKISISLFLSNDYEGGEFCLFDKGEVVAPSPTGSAVAFSSFVPHRVKPVTRGIRWSVVAWIGGPRFQ